MRPAFPLVRHGTRTFRALAGGALIPFLLGAASAPGAEADSTSCREELAGIPDRQNVILLLRGGDSREGSYAGMEGDVFRLQVFDKATSRFRTEEIPPASIASATYVTHSMNWKFPVFLGLLGAGLGIAVWSGLETDPDSGDCGAVPCAAYPFIGAAGGFALGLIPGFLLPQSKEHTISCDAPSSGP